ncbi:MAG: ATP-binding protein, partial [Thermomicrobiales bacterium]|nr:ATP-binding protein [Thermomicrobiales bacterium]
LSFEVEASPDLAVLGDETRLLQVLGNLMSNAIRHTPAGGTIALTARRSEDRFRISVRDTGDGIAPERLPKVFERFERGEREAGPETGFGLGLAIVRELVELHGGTVEVRSELGRGSEFIIELPSAPPDQPFT